MALVIECVLIDCVDLDTMTVFWCEALDLEHTWTGPSGGHLLTARDGSGRRLEGLGARRVDIGQADVTWVVMADPEGNELCVLRSAAERERAESQGS